MSDGKNVSYGEAREENEPQDTCQPSEMLVMVICRRSMGHCKRTMTEIQKLPRDCLMVEIQKLLRDCQ